MQNDAVPIEGRCWEEDEALEAKREEDAAHHAFFVLMSTFAFSLVMSWISAALYWNWEYVKVSVASWPDWAIAILVMLPLMVLGVWALWLLTGWRRCKEDDSI